ncbi:MAG TPA: glycosyltransferase family 92 protein, partial [Candidatus Deferrimicrobium sp.]|nr:glycosyltransferase family 92 protein [Candidatus Deferrimicrobium sp.]
MPLTERGRFSVSVMAILKNEAPNMAEWLCHHMAIGVDHFFLYDNGSTDELHEVLKPFADHGIVTTVYFPMRGLQRDANNHVVRFFGATTEWLAYVDIDEFLVPEQDEQIGEIMRRFGDAEQVLVSRREFCYGGHRTPPAGLVTEAYREYSVDV